VDGHLSSRDLVFEFMIIKDVVHWRENKNMNEDNRKNHINRRDLQLIKGFLGDIKVMNEDTEKRKAKMKRQKTF